MFSYAQERLKMLVLKDLQPMAEGKRSVYLGYEKGLGTAD